MSVSQPFKASDFKCGKQCFLLQVKLDFWKKKINDGQQRDVVGYHIHDGTPQYQPSPVQRHRIFREDRGFSILKLCDSEGSGKFTEWD